MPRSCGTIRAVAALGLSLACAGAFAYTGKVVRVVDGDTVVIAADGRQSTVRLAEVAAPKQGQAFGDRARQALAGLCLNASVEVTPRQDPYGNAVAQVQCQGRDAGEAQVREGMAWVYREFSQNPGRLYALEQEAQAAKRG
ncbi:MAG TPA: thermonuclease family protein, partial [Burkholderiales bacterium]|nr:thermonuclease family protein [Burkholderiales bacterium]